MDKNNKKNFKSDKLLKLCIDLKKHVSSRENINLKKKNPRKFYEQTCTKFDELKLFPALMSGIIKSGDNFEIDRLIDMLSLRENIKEKNMTVEDATKIVGKSYYNEFMHNKLSDKNKNKINSTTYIGNENIKDIKDYKISEKLNNIVKK